jgi:hypothetical protein
MASCADVAEKLGAAMAGSGDRRNRLSNRAASPAAWRGSSTGSAGKITNQIGVFAAYVSVTGHALYMTGALSAQGSRSDPPGWW